MDFSVSDAKTLFTAITELIKKGANLEAEQKLVELREAVLELQTENLELREKINELEQQLSIRESLIYEGVCYWKVSRDGERDGPYCQVCYDSEANLIRLQKQYESLSRNYFYECLKCGNNFDIK